MGFSEETITSQIIEPSAVLNKVTYYEAFSEETITSQIIEPSASLLPELPEPPSGKPSVRTIYVDKVVIGEGWPGMQVNDTNPGFTVTIAIDSIGASDIISHGFVWGEMPLPTLDNWYQDNGAITSPATRTMRYVGTIEEDRQYYVRAYATNASGTTYADEVLTLFTEQETLWEFVGTSDHAQLLNLGLDSHKQYLNPARHDKQERHALGDVVPHDEFINLTDTPGAYTANYLVKVNGGGNGLEFFELSLNHNELEGLDNDDHAHYFNEERHNEEGVHELGANIPHDKFINLTDTPGAFTANEFLKANSEGDGLEFSAIAANDIGALKKQANSTLPTATEENRGQFFLLEGGEEEADKLYVCIKNSDDEYEWKEISPT